MRVVICISVILAVAIAGPTHYSIQNRIAGGRSAQDGQFPFQVGVRTYHKAERYTNWCGGSIISDRFILTAAHCVIGGDSSEILIGSVDIVKGNPLKINVPKEQITMHEEYSHNDNDIALIELPEKLKFSENIMPINLPRISQKNTSFARTVGWITGWGWLGDGKPSPEQLQYARQWILPDESCRRTFGSYYHKDVQICVDGSNGISTCAGDSGGPLSVLEEDGSRTVIGLASYGTQMCEIGYPTVFTRVTKYIEWISKITGVVLRD